MLVDCDRGIFVHAHNMPIRSQTFFGDWNGLAPTQKRERTKSKKH